MSAKGSKKRMAERPDHLRIWVALDESPRSTAALSAAAALAAELDAELAGLFVEDINLQHLVGLPFSRQFSVLSGELHPLSQGEIERSWRRQAASLQRQLAEEAARLRLRWSFRIARGKLSAEVDTRAQAFDLVVLGKRMSMRVRAVAHVPPRMAGIQTQRRVMVLFESDPASLHSLDLGARLARLNGVELVPLIRAENDAAYQAACAAARAALEGQGTAGRCGRLTTLDGASLVQAVHREQAGCLILADKGRFLNQPGFERMLDEIECPIVLIR